MERSSCWSWVIVCVLLTGLPHASAQDPSAFIAPEGKAMIVFIQNRAADRKMQFTVFGADKRCVAQVPGREAQVLPTAPGPYVLFIVGYENTTRIEIYAEAGRTYFVRLHTVDGAVGGVPKVTPVRRASEEHKLLRYHLEGANVTRALDNRDCYGMPLKERSNRTKRRINAANAGWEDADDYTRDQFTLIEADGFTPEDLGRL